MKLSVRLFPVVIFAIFFWLSIRPVAAQNWTDWSGPDGSVRIRAGFVNQTQNAAKHLVAVEVEVEDVWLNYPNVFSEPGLRVGVLQYQLDHCPPILTTDTRLRFQDLPAGDHVVTVRVVDSAGNLLAPRVSLNVLIP